MSARPQEVSRSYAAGFRSAWFLWSDDKTAARIYNGAGFKEVRRFALFRKDFG